MKTWKFYLVNSLTVYRIIASPVLIVLAVSGQYDLFKWLLPISFFTDLVDGSLARLFKVSSERGSKLDSIGDDLTFLAAVVGLFIFKFSFITEQIVLVSVLLGLYFLQMGAALVRYRKLTSFHTYMGKTACLFQGVFLILMFLLDEPLYALFYIASAITIIDLVEEIALIFFLKKWESDVKGLYWILRRGPVKAARPPRKEAKIHILHPKKGGLYGT